MADTTFVNNVTLTDSDWFNDLNRLHYTILNDPADLTALRSTIGVSPASQAQQEAASSNAVSVTPSVQHFHPSALKGWAAVTISGGVPTLAANYNVSSIGDNGAGDFTVNWGTDFSSANYAVVGMVGDFASGSGGYLMDIASTTTITGAAVRVNIKNSAGTNLDPPNRFTIMAAGDQ